ncbi:MAG: hypothetical protein QOC69_1770 [Mycobacterium sp.]|jgi:hypothetical protein|nr:hypothetical protein [Mycobacterium sp.]
MSIASSARSLRCAGATPRAVSPSSTLSWTVSHGINAKDWNTSAAPGLAPLSSLPRVPVVAGMSPAMIRSNVDLPDPDLPCVRTRRLWVVIPNEQR